MLHQCLLPRYLIVAPSQIAVHRILYTTSLLKLFSLGQADMWVTVSNLSVTVDRYDGRVAHQLSDFLALFLRGGSATVGLGSYVQNAGDQLCSLALVGRRFRRSEKAEQSSTGLQ